MLVSETEIAKSTQFTYELDISTKIPSGGKLQMSFHPEFGLQPNQAIACTATYGFENQATCAVDVTGQFIELTGAFPTTDFLLIFTIEGGIVNPAYESTWSNLITSYDAAGLFIETSGATNFSYRTSAGSLTCTLTNLGSDTVAENTDISISLTLTNEVAQDGFFEVSMAKWNSGTQTVGLETSMLEYAATDFDVLRQGYTIPCSSDTHQGITCIFIVASVTSLE